MGVLAMEHVFFFVDHLMILHSHVEVPEGIHGHTWVSC